MNKKNYILWFVVGILCIFLACLSTNYDYDFFARLIVGQNFIENGILPFKDFLSYTPTHPWYDHEWGSGVIFYFILKYFQPIGIVLFQALMMFGTAFFIVKTQKLQKHSYPTSILFITTFLILFFGLNSYLVRCQLFSFFFFALFLYILELYRKKSSQLIWTLPLFTIFWNNVHGGVVAGLGIIFLYFIGALFEKKSWKNYLAVLFLSMVVLPINPYGFEYLGFLFSAATMARKYIVEWWTIFHPHHFCEYVLPLIFVIVPYVLTIYNSIKSKKFDYTKLLILSATILEGMLHAKLISLAIISTAIFGYNDFYKIKFIRRICKTLEKVLYAVVIVVALSIPLYSPNLPRANFDKFPLKEVEFLKINNIKGNIVVPFGLGSYVSYKLYPDNLIYMDGRYEEVYNNREFLILRDYELGEPNWKDIIENYNTEILMTLKTIEVYPILLNSPDWTLIYEGNICGIFVRNGYTHMELAPSDNIFYYRENMFKGNFGKQLKYKGKRDE